MGFNDDLASLVNDIASRVDAWTGHARWVIEPGSAADIEIANTELRRDGSAWGERPVRTVYQLAQMEVKLAVEFSRSVALLIAADRPAPAIEAVTRSALEAASVTWWLLEPGLTARERVCRLQLLRRNNARELANSIAAVGENPAVAGDETIASIEALCSDLNLRPFTQGGNELEGQVRPGYTRRVKDFIDELGYHGAYNIYSGVAHAELSGVWRLFGETAANLADRSPIFSTIVDPKLSFAAADGVLKSMLGSIERIAILFGWSVPGRGEEISETIDYANEQFARLRP